MAVNRQLKDLNVLSWPYDLSLMATLELQVNNFRIYYFKSMTCPAENVFQYFTMAD